MFCSWKDEPPPFCVLSEILCALLCITSQLRHLAPREGWRTEIATAIHGRGIASLSKGVLPQAEVTVTVGGETKVVRAKDHSVSPRFSKKSPMEFRNVAVGSHLLIQVSVGTSIVGTSIEGKIAYCVC